MNPINITLITEPITQKNSLTCVDWCVSQHITHSRNLDHWAVLLIFIAYVFIQLYFLKSNFKVFHIYQEYLIYGAKLSILAFFMVWFLFIKLGIRI